MIIQFEKCTGKPSCRSEEEINAWLRRKFIFTVQNELNFRHDDYTDEKILKSSKVVWYLINSQLRSEYINEIQTTLLELQDSIPFGELKSF